MHEPFGVNLLGDHAIAFCETKKRHHLRLQVGWKSRMRLRRQDRRFEPTITRYAHCCQIKLIAIVDSLDAHADLPKHIERGEQRVPRKSFEHQVAIRRRSSERPSARNNAVGHHGVLNTLQRFNAFDDEPWRTGTADARAHRVEHIGEVDNLGLARRRFNNRLTSRKHRRRHDVRGAGHSRAKRSTEKHRRAAQTIGCFSNDVTILKSNPRVDARRLRIWTSPN